MANLFTSQTPAVADANDGSPGITTATTVRFAQEGTVTGIRFYATATVSGTYTGLLYQVEPTDLPTWLGISFLLIVVALLPTWIPTRRALRIDPMVALRVD